MPWSSDAGPLILGHRGASARAVENTLAAFEAARADGADGVELDVQPCAGGEPVVFHDDTLARLAGRPDAIRALSLAELRAVELRGGARIPTLDETMDALDGMLVNVEIKAGRWRFDPRWVAQVARRVHARLGERGLISSFHPGVVAVARAAVPTARVGLLFHVHQSLPLSRGWPAAVIRPFAVHPQSILVTPRAARAWHRRGYRVHTWTADTATELARLVRCRVDAIITNDPKAARAHVDAARVR